MSEAFDPNDPASLALMVKASVDAYLDRRLGPLAARVNEVELRAPIVGDRGEKGDMGGMGPQGPMGEAGPMGDAGPQGPMGEPGPMGPMGEQGPMGECGPMGEPGPMGPMGDKGADGAVGKDGAPGAIGDKGDVGEKGEAGTQGLAGEKGERGEKGEPGITGKDGAPGPQGQKGLQGEQGEEGRDGKEGQPGRDALRIEIAEGIDAGRSHARGTYASHLGGLWRALRPTDVIAEGATAEQLQTAGWQIVVNGLAEFAVDVAEDGRSAGIALLSTDGRTQVKKVPLSGIFYRSLYVRGNEYQPGDVVTWDGSAWHCETQTKGEPGASPDWKLFVRKGRDRANP